MLDQKLEDFLTERMFLGHKFVRWMGDDSRPENDGKICGKQLACSVCAPGSNSQTLTRCRHEINIRLSGKDRQEIEDI